MLYESLTVFIISRVVQWIQSQKCGEVAIQVMRELLAVSGMNALSQASMDSLVTAIKVGCVVFLHDI